jgi:5-formyltetrahydrofolate cyclo-ligase
MKNVDIGTLSSHTIRMSNDKHALRNILKQKINAIPLAERQERDLKIILQIMDVLNPAHDIVGLYKPLRHEIDIRPLFSILQKRGLVTALPAILSPDQPLEFRRFHTEDILEKTSLGFFQPPASADKVIPNTLIIPVVGYTNKNFRLGMGVGFYDRTLEQFTKEQLPFTIGVGYTCQLCAFDISPHDKPLDLIISA